MQYRNTSKDTSWFVYYFYRPLRQLYATRTEVGDSFAKYLRCAIGIFLFAALFLTSDIAYSSFVISLKEIPEWAPGHSLEIRQITIDGEGAGNVVLTNENAGISEVSQIALFRYDPSTFAHWEVDYLKYKDFYGVDEDSDNRIVEGNPQTVVLSFFSDGQPIKFISIRGELAYSDESAKQFALPAALIELRNKLLAYAEQSEPQIKAEYYMTAIPYSENEKNWLLKSVKLESIPTLTNIGDEKELAFLELLIKNMPAFLPLDENFGLKFKEHIKPYSNQSIGIFRTSKESDTIVQIKLMRSTRTRQTK